MKNGERNRMKEKVKGREGREDERVKMRKGKAERKHTKGKPQKKKPQRKKQSFVAFIICACFYKNLNLKN